MSIHYNNIMLTMLCAQRCFPTRVLMINRVIRQAHKEVSIMYQLIKAICFCRSDIVHVECLKAASHEMAPYSFK